MTLVMGLKVSCHGKCRLSYKVTDLLLSPVPESYEPAINA